MQKKIKQAKHMDFKYYGVGTKLLPVLVLLVLGQNIYSQTQPFNLRDLSAFSDPGKSWMIAGEVHADLNQQNELKTQNGTGVLVNRPGKRAGQDLYTIDQYGNIDLAVDYMMAKGSNSGIYFQGQYELQLNDSWGRTAVTSGENGGIYARWDDQKPEGEKAYQGYAPRQNVSRAPGLWQHLEVSFQAPRFNENGEKIENAKFIYVRLNGVTIHEDLELSGPTRGSMEPGEKTKGPLRIQGDHGAVAFRNMEITRYDKPRPELTNLKFTVYEGRYDKEPDYNKLPPEAEGESVVLTSDLSTKAEQFLVRYIGVLRVEEAGEYTFNLNTSGGAGLIRINGDEVVPLSNGRGEATVNLSAGELPFELLYSKIQDWADPGLGLTLSGEGIREYLISEDAGDMEEPVDPILVEANTSKVFRSFMNLPGSENSRNHLLTHAVSVGNPKQLHYTYDLNSGTVVQIWRGGFIDATPMWYSRGNGTSRPQGSILHLGAPTRSIAKLSSPQQQWAADTTGSNFTNLGYRLDENNLPTFRYSIYGAQIEDASRVTDDSYGIERKISVDTPVKNLHVRLAGGKKIEKLSNELFVVGDKEYYIRMDNVGKAKPILKGSNNEQELLMPLEKELTYTILF